MDQDSPGWRGLNSHGPLCDTVKGDFELNEKQLEEMETD